MYFICLSLIRQQEVLSALDEREPGKDKTLDSAEGIQKDYNDCLNAAIQEVKAMPSNGLDPAAVIKELDVESRPHAEAMETSANDTKQSWDDLKQQAMCLEGCLSTKLDLLKDAGTAMDALLQSVADIQEKLNNLPLISAIREEYEQQLKETEVGENLIDRSFLFSFWNSLSLSFPGIPFPILSDLLSMRACTVFIRWLS